MKKALIDTQTSVAHIVSWQYNNPIYETYANSARVCEITDTTFEVYKTLIWVDCEDDIVADQFWYDLIAQTFNPVENAPQPQIVQPTTEGTESV
jgi:hypothetical protein